MLGAASNLLPMVFGYMTKLIAIKSQSESDTIDRLIKLNSSKEANVNMARDVAEREDKGAQWFRRSIVFIILAFVFIIIIVPPIAKVFGYDIPLIVKDVTGGGNFLGIFSWSGITNYVEIDGLLKFDEVFDWSLMILEFYFGSQMAKGR